LELLGLAVDIVIPYECFVVEDPEEDIGIGILLKENEDEEGRGLSVERILYGGGGGGSW